MQISESKKINTNEDILPLINVVFLLLIFFILSGVFTKPELFIVTPPESNNSTSIEEGRIEILINKNGDMALGKDPIDVDQLRREIRVMSEVASEKIIRLKADRDVEMKHIFSLMDMFKAEKVENFSLVTVKK